MNKDDKGTQGQQEINSKVLKQGLCTGCSACVGLCPSMEYYKDKIIFLHDCDLDKGRCYAYCPRTPTDFEGLRRALFNPDDMVLEIGAFKGLYMTRASNEKIRANAQHGGTVTALIQLALSEGMIDKAILVDQNDQFLSDAQIIDQGGDSLTKAKSKFVVSPTVSAFNRISSTDAGKIGVVATPCQALALAKMKVNPALKDQVRMEKLRLVIGLFCGWALDWQKLKNLLKETVGDLKIEGIDIPPSSHACMEVYTEGKTIKIPIEDVNKCVRDNCSYCFDMTCEFADISIGAARSPEGWDVDKGWNQVIVRTSKGAKLLEKAIEKGILEFRDVPDKNIEKLKIASLNKKRNCLKHLEQKTGNRNDLIYIDPEDPVVRHIGTVNLVQ
ncbi:Coenzyme F420 hydrogenase/dehydrogenase, beta subunit C-terminal domain [Desulfobacula sp.]